MTNRIVALTPSTYRSTSMVIDATDTLFTKNIAPPYSSSFCDNTWGIPYPVLVVTNLVSTTLMSLLLWVILTPTAFTVLNTISWTVTIIWLIFLAYMEYGDYLKYLLKKYFKKGTEWFNDMVTHLKGILPTE